MRHGQPQRTTPSAALNTSRSECLRFALRQGNRVRYGATERPFFVADIGWVKFAVSMGLGFYRYGIVQNKSEVWGARLRSRSDGCRREGGFRSN